MEATVNKVLDAKGLACPMPIVKGGAVTFLTFAKDAGCDTDFLMKSGKKK